MINLDELERLHAAATPGVAADYHPALSAAMTRIYIEFPALSAELRTRRKQVEEARRAMRAVMSDSGTKLRPSVVDIVAAALASLESGEGGK